MYAESLNLVEVPETPPRRPRVLMVGTGFAVAGILMYFASLLGIYLALRGVELSAGRAWFPEDLDIPLTQANMLLFTLLLSVVMIHWASQAARNDDRQHLYLSLGLTLLLGFAFFNQAIYLFTISGLDISAPETGIYALLVYVIAVSHLILLVAGMLYLVIVAFRALGGQETSMHHDGVRAAAMLWDVMVFVFALIWIIVYVTK